jgi:hypothetical protein
VKVKKLDSFIYTELEPRIGEYWYLWKCAYDEVLFNQKTKPEIWIDENSNKFLIVSTFMTIDAGKIPYVILDSLAPVWYVNSVLPDEQFINCCGYTIIDNSRGNLVIPLYNYSNFLDYKKSISSQLIRYWNKCEKKISIRRINTEDFQKWYILFEDSKYTYWKDRVDYHINYMEPDLIVGSIFTDKCFLLSVGTEPVSFIWFSYNKVMDEIEWINTYYRRSKYKKYALGNYTLLKSIQLMFGYHTFNMGIHIYAYKYKYLSKYRKVKGIRKL